LVIMRYMPQHVRFYLRYNIRINTRGYSLNNQTINWLDFLQSRLTHHLLHLIALLIMLSVTSCQKPSTSDEDCSFPSSGIALYGYLSDRIMQVSDSLLYFNFRGIEGLFDKTGLYSYNLNTHQVDSFLTVNQTGQSVRDFYIDDASACLVTIGRDVYQLTIPAELTRLTFNEQYANPTLLSNINAICVNRLVEPKSGVWLLNMDGTQNKLLLQYGMNHLWKSDQNSFVSWHGDKILVLADTAGVVIDTLIQSNEFLRIYPNSFSQAGNQLLFTAIPENDPMNRLVYIYSFDTGEVRYLCQGEHAVWDTAIDSILYFCGVASNELGLWKLDLSTCTRSRILTQGYFEDFLGKQ